LTGQKIERSEKSLRKRPISITILRKLFPVLNTISMEKANMKSTLPKSVKWHGGADKTRRSGLCSFASVYRQFRDINEFMSELKDLLLKKEE
jgi:transcriptional repressor NrdR